MPSSTRTEPLNCRCGKELGKSIYANNMFIGAQFGGLLVTESAHGRCPSCGRGVHIVVSPKTLVKLLSHYGGIPEMSMEISE